MTVVLGELPGGLPRDGNELVAALLILVLGVALGIGVACLLMVVHFLRKGRLVQRLPARRRNGTGPGNGPGTGSGHRPGDGAGPGRERRPQVPLFHVPSRWLAVRSGNPNLVQAALGLHNPMPCSWEEGLSAAHDQKLFISPPIRGWVLVLGTNLPEPGEDVDRCFKFILELSRKLGAIQFFSVNRAVNHHAWISADKGSVQRAYAWAGRTVWNQGPPTKAEIELALKCYPYGEGEDRMDFGRPDPVALNTERLPLLAARWSLDPTAIDARMLRENQGIAGQLSKTKAH